MKTAFTVGFVFDESLSRVLLMRKARPDWQKGKLNGVGGHMEAGETPKECMVREFGEEVEGSGVAGANERWMEFADMGGTKWSVVCFVSVGDIDNMRGKGDEPTEVVAVSELATRTDLLGNIPWLVHLAKDSLMDTGPSYSFINYP